MEMAKYDTTMFTVQDYKQNATLKKQTYQVMVNSRSTVVLKNLAVSQIL